MLDFSEAVKEKIGKDLIEVYRNTVDRSSIKLRTYYDNKDDIVEDLNENPVFIINQIIPNIKYEKYELDSCLESNEDVRVDHAINVYDKFQLKEFLLITGMGEFEYKFIHDDVTELRCEEVGVNMDIEDYNYFTGDIYIKGTFSPPNYQPEMDLYLLDNAGTMKALIKVYGILKNDITPGWIYYLVEGCVTYNSNNKKMAVLNIFAALDNFIEYLYSKIFEYYVSQYNELTNYSKKMNSKECAENDKACLINKIKSYAKDTKRLDEKLKDIMREVNIKGDNPKFTSLCNINKINFSNIEKIRNKVAHGEIYSVEEVDFGECLYYILTVILSILYVHDFEADHWNEIMK